MHKFDTQPGTISVKTETIKSKTVMKILGVNVDQKLTWYSQVEKSISDAKKAARGLAMVRRFFNDSELITLITSLIYSRLYYAAQVWLLPTLHSKLYQKLYSQSGQILKMLDRSLTFDDLHRAYQRATPRSFATYQTALNLYELCNSNYPEIEWHNLNLNILNARRNRFINCTSNNKLMVGYNRISNRFSCLNNKVDYNWLNGSLVSFKVTCKHILM